MVFLPFILLALCGLCLIVSSSTFYVWYLKFLVLGMLLFIKFTWGFYIRMLLYAEENGRYIITFQFYFSFIINNSALYHFRFCCCNLHNLFPLQVVHIIKCFSDLDGEDIRCFGTFLLQVSTYSRFPFKFVVEEVKAWKNIIEMRSLTSSLLYWSTRVFNISSYMCRLV